ncbi:hypothetical protein D3C76_1452010 [compost metagenome]
MAACAGTEAEMLVISFNRSICPAKRPPETQPTRYPGARLLEKELQCITRPSLSKAFTGLGACWPKYSSA